VASVFAALAGCPSSGAGPRLGDTFVLGVGDTTTIADLNLWIRFAQVSSDSRCPSQVSCTWSGDAAVVLEVAPFMGDSKVDTLHTALDPQSVDPYPVTAGSIPARSYRATIITQEVPTN